MSNRIARSLAVLGLAAGAVAVTAAPSSAFPTEHVEIHLTIDATDPSYGADVHVTGGTATETFDINIVRVDSAGPRVAGCTGANDCHIDGDLSSETLPAVFVVHVVGGQKTLFDNAFDSYVQTTVCTTSASCTSSPVILSLG
ncbi:MAG: hypothetical protein QOE45_2482 [Frankiaceae bacterium]|nr:hypothetical protein [Frankiaceae bacterium]